MLSDADNILLTRTGPKTPMGDLFRRFWQPVLLSAELPEPDGAPLRVTVLGEDLRAFRATDGSVGLVSPRCPHRGADLFFGRNEEGGIRCAYHGWKFATDGRCLAMPTMDPGPARERAEQNVRLPAYPTREAGGFVWAYLGPREHQPALPELEFLTLPASHVFVSKKLQQCNWAQACEGGLDTAHFSFLHMAVSDAADVTSRLMTQSFVRPRHGALDARRWRAALHHHRASGRSRPRRRPPRRSRRELLAHQPVPDAQSRPRPQRLPGRELPWPVLGADRRHLVLDPLLHLEPGPPADRRRAGSFRAAAPVCMPRLTRVTSRSGGARTTI